MTELENFVEKFVRTAKQNDSLKNIRFVNAYNPRAAEKPVVGFIAAVEIAGINDDIKFNTRLIGGSDVSGSQLGYTAVELAAAYKEADADSCVDSIVLSETKYDKSIAAFYRDIKLSLSLRAAGLDDNRIDINGESVSGITSIKWSEILDGVSLYEFNRGEPYALINSKRYYEITVEARSVSLLSVDNGFTLRSGSVSFLNCRFSKISTSLNTKGQIVYKTVIISDRKVTV